MPTRIGVSIASKRSLQVLQRMEGLIENWHFKANYANSAIKFLFVK